MSWVKVDDKAWCHWKLIGLSGDAVRLWLFGLCWCSQQETDGRLPRVALQVLRGTPEAASELVTAGLWHDHGDAYEVHDYLTYQPSAADSQARREARAAAGRVGGVRSGASRASRTVAENGSIEANGKQARSKREANAKHLLGTCFDNVEANANPGPARPDPNPMGTPPVGPPPPDSGHGHTLPHTASTPEQAPAPPKAKKARQNPIGDWQPDASMAELARSLGLDAALEAEKMRDWALSNNKTKADWNATFRNWLRRAAPDARLPARSGVSNAAPGGGRGGGSLTVAKRATGATESLTERAARYAREIREDCPDLWGDV